MQTRRLPNGLYAITPEDQSGATLLDNTAAILENGAAVLQYRAKTGADVTTARSLKALCQIYKATFLINDDPQLAADVDADGVHLGSDDQTLAIARGILGTTKIIGVSCYNNLQRSLEAESAGADYVAFGSFFASPTKPRAVSADLNLLREARRNLSLAIVAIGGITPDNGAALVTAGANLLAVISGVYAAEDPGSATTRYGRLFENNNNAAI